MLSSLSSFSSFCSEFDVLGLLPPTFWADELSTGLGSSSFFITPLALFYSFLSYAFFSLSRFLSSCCYLFLSFMFLKFSISILCASSTSFFSFSRCSLFYRFSFFFWIRSSFFCSSSMPSMMLMAIAVCFCFSESGIAFNILGGM